MLPEEEEGKLWHGEGSREIYEEHSTAINIAGSQGLNSGIEGNKKGEDGRRNCNKMQWNHFILSCNHYSTTVHGLSKGVPR